MSVGQILEHGDSKDEIRFLNIIDKITAGKRRNEKTDQEASNGRLTTHLNRLVAAASVRWN